MTHSRVCTKEKKWQQNKEMKLSGHVSHKSTSVWWVMVVCNHFTILYQSHSNTYGAKWKVLRCILYLWGLYFKLRPIIIIRRMEKLFKELLFNAWHTNNIAKRKTWTKTLRKNKWISSLWINLLKKNKRVAALNKSCAWEWVCKTRRKGIRANKKSNLWKWQKNTLHYDTWWRIKEHINWSLSSVAS